MDEKNLNKAAEAAVAKDEARLVEEMIGIDAALLQLFFHFKAVKVLPGLSRKRNRNPQFAQGCRRIGAGAAAGERNGNVLSFQKIPVRDHDVGTAVTQTQDFSH